LDEEEDEERKDASGISWNTTEEVIAEPLSNEHPLNSIDETVSTKDNQVEPDEDYAAKLRDESEVIVAKEETSNDKMEVAKPEVNTEAEKKPNVTETKEKTKSNMFDDDDEPLGSNNKPKPTEKKTGGKGKSLFDSDDEDDFGKAKVPKKKKMSDVDALFE